MIHRGIATFTLDEGKCPKWLFERLVRLGRGMLEIIIDEYGPEEFIKRIADPVWFQALGTVLAFDWNSSGLTTILTAALKEAIRGQEKDLGVFIAGGKGKTSRKTPEEIENWGDKLNLPQEQTKSLVYNSRLSAKVDSALVQDGFQIYHHAFFFSKKGSWAVVQQGMNTVNQTARRYHWYSDKTQINADETQINADNKTQINADETQINTDNKTQTKTSAFSFVCEPHRGIVSELKQKFVLNLVSRQSGKTRDLSVQLVQAGYHSLIKDIQILRKHSSPIHQMAVLKINNRQITFLNLENEEFKFHPVILEDFSQSRYLEKILMKVCDIKPSGYETLLATAGMGPKTMRALALVSEIIYGAKPSYEDPARYSFAHGGKDATPYPVDRQTYDQTIEMMKRAVAKIKLDFSEKRRIIQNLEK